MELKDLIKNRRLELNLTMKELAKRVGVSEGTISRWESGHISNMRRDRALSLAKALSIPIEIVMGWEGKKPIPESTSAINNVTVPEARELPILGEICAGDGIFCEENYEGTFCVDNTIKADYCLRVRGDSMIDAGIEAGDMAFIARAYDFHDGDIYAVLKNGEYTASLKRVYLQADQIVLAACSTAYAPEILAAGDVSILGEFVGVYKPKKT